MGSCHSCAHPAGWRCPPQVRRACARVAAGRSRRHRTAGRGTDRGRRIRRRGAGQPQQSDRRVFRAARAAGLARPPATGQLAGGGGSLLDTTPAASLACHGARTGLIVLRSLGKFLALASARVGFTQTANDLLRKLADALGPWPLPGPARGVAMSALNDRPWHAHTRTALPTQAARLQALLATHGLPTAGGCGPFQWLCTPRAAALHDALARRGILTRLFVQPAGLRFGLPATETDWQRLDQALTSYRP